MGFPDKPDVLNLTSLEEWLISPFIQIRELPRGGQLSIHGNIVNVPSDVIPLYIVSQRPLSESQTIPIKLKRRLNYKHRYQFQNVRPKRVLDAARYLVDTSDLFREGIEVQNRWLNCSVICCVTIFPSSLRGTVWRPRGRPCNALLLPAWLNCCVAVRICLFYGPIIPHLSIINFVSISSVRKRDCNPLMEILVTFGTAEIIGNLCSNSRKCYCWGHKIPYLPRENAPGPP